jgi:hypothetical protein
VAVAMLAVVAAPDGVMVPLVVPAPDGVIVPLVVPAPDGVIVPLVVPAMTVGAVVAFAGAEVVGVGTGAGLHATRAASAVAATVPVKLVRNTLSLKIPPDVGKG